MAAVNLSPDPLRGKLKQKGVKDNYDLVVTDTPRGNNSDVRWYKKADVGVWKTVALIGVVGAVLYIGAKKSEERWL